MNVHDYAVVVGISRYPNAPLEDLHGPEHDALGFRQWLLSPTGGDLPDDGQHVYTVLSSSFPNNVDPLRQGPLNSDIDFAFDKIVLALQDQPPETRRRIYIFFAGHGIAPRTGITMETDLDESAILMANAGERRWGYNIAGRLYAESFRATAMFKEIVLIMDCCRDNLPSASTPPPPWDTGQVLDAGEVKRFYAFATRWSRKSRERQFGPNAEYEGVFSHSILTALNSGRLTSTQLKDFVINDMAKNLKAVQRPDFPLPDEGIIFSEGAAPPQFPVKLTFTPAYHGKEIEIVDGKFRKIDKFQATNVPWERPLPVGMYRVRYDANKEPLELDVLGGPRDVQF